MNPSIHAIATGTFIPMLRTLALLLDKGLAHAAARKFEPSVLFDARLAPDMFPLAKHVQMSCSGAVDAFAKLTGADTPKTFGDERTLDELKARIAATVTQLEHIPSDALDGAEDRIIHLPISEEMQLEMNGLQFLRDWSIPQFYFHIVTTYALLRHNGVDIGIRDYGSQVGGYLRPRAH